MPSGEITERTDAPDNDLADADQTIGAPNVAAVFAELALDLFASGELSHVLRRIVEVANVVIDGCDFASVTLLEDDRFSTPVYTHTQALRADEAQYTTDEGPCIDALASTTVHATASNWDENWPQWGPRAREIGVQSVLAVPLRIPNTHHTRLGAVNMYSLSGAGFTTSSQEMALVLSAHAAIAAVVSREKMMAATREKTFNEALASRDVIGQAKGMLMERHAIGADEAFDVLRRASQRLNTKLRDVATEVVRNHANSAD